MNDTIPIAAIDQHIAILGKTGSGKTFAAKGIVERLLNQKRQVCVVDPTSAWWGLRLGADGKSRGFDIVLLGGEHGDLQLSERSGPAVARLVTEQGASVVIDTGGMTVGEYTRWFIDFAGTLYTTIRNPLHLVIDEAHYFMPQSRTLSVDGGKMLHNGNRLMSGGRSRGIRAMMITQRPAKLHKDSLTCADTLIAMRMIAPQDRDAVKEWIAGAGDPVKGKAVLDSLAGLDRGEGWVWYPAGGYLERTKFPPIRTFDSSAAPKHGQVVGPTVASINLEEVKTALAEAVKEAEANDPKLLRAEVSRLKAELAKKPGAVAAEPAKLVAEYNRGVADERRRWTTGMNGVPADLVRVGTAIGKAVDVLARLGDLPDIPANAVMTKEHLLPSATSRAKSVTPRIVAADGPLTEPQRKILDTVLMLNTRGIEANRDSIARWLGIHPNGGSYGTNLGALRSAGYLTGCVLTELGKQEARPLETGVDAALRMIEDEPKRRIIREVMNAGSPGLSREELAARIGIHPNGGSYGTNLGRLRTMGLITARGPIATTPGLYA